MYKLVSREIEAVTQTRQEKRREEEDIKIDASSIIDEINAMVKVAN